VQGGYFPRNDNVTGFDFQHSVAKLESQFADYHGQTLILWRRHTLGADPDVVIANFLPGNESLAAGVRAVNAYTGMGFRPFADYFCFKYLANTMCRLSYARLWQPTSLDGQRMADLLRLKTVVVDDSIPFRPVAARAGWRVQERAGSTTVLVRRAPATRWPAGRLSYAGPGVQILDDRVGEQGRSETVHLGATGGGGTLAFARLNWPGYHADIDGRRIAVRDGPGGLVTVHVPAALQDATLHLHWTPPGHALGVTSALVGVLGALFLGGFSAYNGWAGRRRVRRSAGSH